MATKAVPAVIATIVVLVLALAGFLLWPMLKGGAPIPSGSSGIDSGARIEIEVLSQKIENLQGRVADLENEVTSLRAGAFKPNTQQALDDDAGVSTGPNTIVNDYAKVVLIANRRKVNNGISVASPSFLEKFLGRPREVLSDVCESMTNPALKELLVLEDVGPIRVRLLQPAVDSITRVFERVKSADPDLHARIKSSGSLCVRQIRGTRGRTSTHSFGLAVDLNIDGQLDNFADGKTQLGLTILADYFIEEGWVWGAGFSREDSMHFEVSKQMLSKWRAEGKI